MTFVIDCLLESIRQAHKKGAIQSGRYRSGVGEMTCTWLSACHLASIRVETCRSAIIQETWKSDQTLTNMKAGSQRLQGAAKEVCCPSFQTSCRLSPATRHSYKPFQRCRSYLTMAIAAEPLPPARTIVGKRPNSDGRFGCFGGKYVRSYQASLNLMILSSRRRMFFRISEECQTFLGVVDI